MPYPPPKPEDLERALFAMVMLGGNAEKASELLAIADPPFKVTGRSLLRWKDRYAQRYAEIHDEHIAELETVVLQQVREAAMKAGVLQALTVESLIKRVQGGEVETKDLANILKAAGISLGINVEKMLLLTNRPTSIAEKRDVNELLESISRRVPGLIVSDAEVIDPPPCGRTEGARVRWVSRRKSPSSRLRPLIVGANGAAERRAPP